MKIHKIQDGRRVESGSTTPWIPMGRSGWEFGVNDNPSKKANDDYKARTNSIPLSERQETTFVFVTTRNWRGKEGWIKSKKEKAEWKDVKAYDASDLEQWIEQSICAQIWFGEQVGISDNHILSLDQCWENWASVTEPVLNKELFNSTVKMYKNDLEGWLKRPPLHPLIVTADSEGSACFFSLHV